jgi:hypothetical protein
MANSPFDWRSGGPSVVYQDPKLRAAQDGKSRTLRQLEVMERKERDTGRRPELQLVLSERAAARQPGGRVRG